MFTSSFRKNLVSNIRSFFKTTMDTLDIVQGHAEQAVDMFYKGSTGVQKQCLEVFKEWLKESKKFRDQMRKLTEDYLDSIEKILKESEE